MENPIFVTYAKKRRWDRRGGNYPDSGGTDRTGHYLQVSADQSGTDDFRKNYQRKRGNLTEVRGEITVFLSLIFILLISFIGAVMESASIQMAKNYRRADMNRAIESVFAEYQKELLEEYEIFALDGSYETGQYSEQNLMDRLEYYGAGSMEQKILRIQFLTDDGCQAFWEQVSSYMEQKYGLDIVKEWTGMTSVWGQQEDQAGKYRAEEQEKEQNLEDLLAANEGELPKEENPIDHVGELQSSPILELVMPKDKEVSNKQTDASELLENRELNEGYGDFSDVAEEGGTLSSLLFGEYLLEHFSMFTDEEKTGTLDYELEYILEGKSSDRENLEAVVTKLMLLRFVPNYAYIQTDAAMKAEAEAMALTLCSLLAVPAITAAAAQVILLAWAYGETVMDLRSLLNGSRVPLVKSKESWQLSLSSLLKLGTDEDQSEGMDTEGGLLYREYLRMLLFLESRETSAIRTLGMIEQNLKGEHGQSYFRADLCISRVEFQSEVNLRRGIRFTFPTYFGYQ